MYSLIIVDDEHFIRMTISGYISQFHPNFSVDGIFSNGEDALHFLQNNPVNVIITDIRMPKMDGLEFATYVHEHFPDIIMIIISGFCEFEYAQKAIHCGVSNYLLKPLDFDELSRDLTQIYEKLNLFHTLNNFKDEDIQLFFTELINGSMQEQEALQRFSRLDLSGNPQDYYGSLLQLDLESSAELNKWKYGREKLAAALLNCLRMTLADYLVYYLFRVGMRYFFVVLSKKEPTNIYSDSLSSILFQLLHFRCKIQVQCTFEGILSLLKAPLEEYNQLLSPTLSLDQSTDADTNNVIIQKSKEYIQLHCSEDLTREDVAKAVYLSPVYFSRFFKQKTGLSFIDYLTSVRMQKAVELLATHMRVMDIAKAVGYQSRNRFHINFRQYFGLTPTEYRRQHLKMEGFHENTEE